MVTRYGDDEVVARLVPDIMRKKSPFRNLDVAGAPASVGAPAFLCIGNRLFYNKEDVS